MLGLMRKVLRDLCLRRTRSALTLLGIAVGVAGVVAIFSTARNVAQAQREVFASTSQADIVYWVWNASRNLVSLLQADPRIAAAELRLSYVTQWRVADSWRDIELVGIDDLGRVTLNRFELVEGRLPHAGEALLEVSAARGVQIAPGSEIGYRDGNGRERYLRISGLLRSPSYLSAAITNTPVGETNNPGVSPRTIGIPWSNDLKKFLNNCLAELFNIFGRILTAGVYLNHKTVMKPCLDSPPGLKCVCLSNRDNLFYVSSKFFRLWLSRLNRFMLNK